MGICFIVFHIVMYFLLFSIFSCDVLDVISNYFLNYI